MKMKKLRVFVGILIIVVSLCLMSSCSGGTPSVSEMEQDYVGDKITMLIKNPFTGKEELETFEVINFQCEKSQTTEWGFDAFCIVSFSNEYYEFTKDVTMHYTKYDGNVYEFSGYDDSVSSYIVKANPYTIEDCIKWEKGKRYIDESDEIKETAIELDESSGTEIGWGFRRISKFPNATLEYIHSGEYMFNGEKWELDDHNYIVNSIDWQIEGTWTCNESSNENIVELVINNFNPNSRSISGYIITETEGKMEFNDCRLNIYTRGPNGGSGSIWLGDYSELLGKISNDSARIYFKSFLVTDVVDIMIDVDDVSVSTSDYFGYQTLYKK